MTKEQEHFEKLAKVEEEAFIAMTKTFTEWAIAHTKSRKLPTTAILLAISRTAFTFSFGILRGVGAIDFEESVKLERETIRRIGVLIKEQEKQR